MPRRTSLGEPQRGLVAGVEPGRLPTRQFRLRAISGRRRRAGHAGAADAAGPRRDTPAAGSSRSAAARRMPVLGDVGGVRRRRRPRRAATGRSAAGSARPPGGARARPSAAPPLSGSPGARPAAAPRRACRSKACARAGTTSSSRRCDGDLPCRARRVRVEAYPRRKSSRLTGILGVIRTTGPPPVPRTAPTRPAAARSSQCPPGRDRASRSRRIAGGGEGPPDRGPQRDGDAPVRTRCSVDVGHGSASTRRRGAARAATSRP